MLQLIGVLSLRMVTGHYKHSPLAYSNLKAYKRVSLFCIIISSRTNQQGGTPLCMIDVLEQKMALNAYSSDPSLNITQFNKSVGHGNKTILVLDQITKFILTEQASASLVISFIRDL